MTSSAASKLDLNFLGVADSIAARVEERDEEVIVRVNHRGGVGNGGGGVVNLPARPRDRRFGARFEGVDSGGYPDV